MSNRLKASLLIAACLGATVLWLILATREPKYQGQPVSYWFQQYVFSFSPKREETLETLAEMGSDAIPYLARMVSRNDSHLGRAYRSYWPKLSARVKRWLPQPIDPARRHADAAVCLSRLGLSYQSAIPPLIAALKDSKTEKRLVGLRALRDIGPMNDDIVAAVIASARDPDPIVESEAVGTLWEFIRASNDHSSLTQAVPLLIEALGHSNREIRHAAALALRDLGPAANEAVPMLLGKLQDSSASIEDRLDAACALGCIDAERVDLALLVLQAALNNDGAGGNIWMVPESLARMAASSKSVSRTLVNFLKSPNVQGDSDSGLRLRTIVALGQMGRAAIDAVPVLTNALNDANEGIRFASANAVWRIDPSQARIVLSVFSGAVREGTRHAADAAHALGQLGPAARDVVPILIDALNARDPFVRQAVALALWRIDPKQAPAIVPVLIAQLARRDVSHLSRVGVIEALGQVGSAAAAAAPLIAENLTHRDLRVELAAAKALWKIDAQRIPQVVARLIGYLQRKDCWHREVAAGLLGEIGPEARTAARVLRWVANEGDEKLRDQALEALRAIEAGTVGPDG